MSIDTFSYKNLLRNLLLTFLFNILIAVFLTTIKFGGDFIVNLIFSQSIGISCFISCYTALYLFKPAKLIGQIITIAVALIVGVISGNIIGYAANGLDPLFFINENSEIAFNIIIFSLLFSIIISYFFISREKIFKERANRLVIEKKAIETELKNLESQIEPHFLVNTLSTVISLIDKEPDTARTMIEELVNILRSSLSISRHETITIGEEMRLIKSYLNIMKVRMKNRLHFKIEISDSVSDYQISPLLIQPLVENAVKHGIEPKIEGGELRIEVGKDNGRLKIVVSDTGIGFDYKNPSSGFGLDNIRKRLDLLYNKKGKLILMENQPSGLKAIIEIPYETDKGNCC